MRLIIILLALYTLTASAHNKIPAVFQPPPDTCVCRDENCWDTSCEESHCLCLVSTFREIKEKNQPWPKGWTGAILKLVQERCLCIKRCQNICSPSGLAECTSAAYDKFVCSYKTLLKEIKKKPGYDEFVSTVAKINVNCINRDCKTTCSGGSCDAFIPVPCGDCIRHSLREITSSIKDEKAHDIVDEYTGYINLYYAQVFNCRGHKSCIGGARDSLEVTLRDFSKKLNKSIGSCAGVAILSTIKQAAVNCAASH